MFGLLPRQELKSKKPHRGASKLLRQVLGRLLGERAATQFPGQRVSQGEALPMHALRIAGAPCTMG